MTQEPLVILGEGSEEIRSLKQLNSIMLVSVD